jgi:uncharacterized protein
MPETTIATAHTFVWVELATPDAAASRDFYAKLFGWQIEVNPDPQYGGYALAQVGDAQAAGIGPKMSPEAPTAWGLYVGTDDVDGVAQKVSGAGGMVLAPAFDVGDQGRMAVFADPTGAAISAWQAGGMRNFLSGEANSLGWAELNSRGLARAIPFYEAVFGWTHDTSPFGEGQEYTQFYVDGEAIAGALEMQANVSADMPSYWSVYFKVDDVDAAFQKAIGLGATEMVAPQDYPGGRFAIVSDPQGAMFALYKGGGI